MKRKARARGKYAEKTTAKKLGGRLVRFSGAGVLEKGDIRIENCRPKVFIEMKYSGEILAKTGARSVSFQLEWAEKTILDAQAALCVPVIAIKFANTPTTLYVTTDEYFEELLSQSQRLYEVEKALDVAPTGTQPGQ